MDFCQVKVSPKSVSTQNELEISFKNSNIANSNTVNQQKVVLKFSFFKGTLRLKSNNNMFFYNFSVVKGLFQLLWMKDFQYN